MGLRLGSRSRKEKQPPENEKKEKPKKGSKSHKKSNDIDKSNSRPPPAPGNLKSFESRNPAVINTSGSDTTFANAPTIGQSTSGNRGVTFRDNRFPDGTIMPRIPTTQTYLTPPGADKDGRVSPTGSIYSTASLQAHLPHLNSYPLYYVPQTHSKHFDATPRFRERFHSDGNHRSVYGDLFPKPDYPPSNDGTGNSNIDSGLDSESRSSSGGKPAFANVYDHSYSPQQLYKHRQQTLTHDRPSKFHNTPEVPQNIHSKGYQGAHNYNLPNYSTPQRYRKTYGHPFDDTYLISTPQRWVNPKEDFEEETYRPQSAYGPIHCSSCSCAEGVVRTPRCTSSLRRIQLEDEVPSRRRWDTLSMNGKRDRSYRREDDEEFTLRSASRGLPRNVPVRGKYFEEQEEVDRYGRLLPVRRPKIIRSRRRDFYEYDDDSNDNEGVQDDEFDYSDEEESDFQENCKNFASRRTMPGFYDTSEDISPASRDTSVIRL